MQQNQNKNLNQYQPNHNLEQYHSPENYPQPIQNKYYLNQYENCQQAIQQYNLR